jgi:hypothetical protein
MMEYDEAARVWPTSLRWLLPLAAAIAGGAWWWLCLGDVRTAQLTASLLGTALLASAFGPHASVGEFRAPHATTWLGQLSWRMRRSGAVSAVAYYPAPFYLGLVLLVVASVLGVLPDSR